MIKHLVRSILLIICVAFFNFHHAKGNLQTDIDVRLRMENYTSLTRTRRYLVFPEGSSFQVVYDLAYPTLDGIGLYVFGHTAALAWELPSTPVFLDKKFHKKQKPEPEPTTMLPHLEHPVDYEHDFQLPLSWDDTHKMDSWGYNKHSFIPNYGSSYTSKFGHIDRSPVAIYVNPFDGQKGFSGNRYPSPYVNANSKRDYSYSSDPQTFWSKRTFQNARRKTPIKPSSYGGGLQQFDKTLHNSIHRITRRELYGKIEDLLTKLFKNGKSCVLKAICLIYKTPKGKGTLFQELLKTLFKVKPEDDYEEEDHYDAAANSAPNCHERYPECKENILGKLLNAQNFVK